MRGTPLLWFVATMLVSTALVASCSAVLGFPDRVLDESIGNAPDGEPADGGRVVYTGPARATFSASAVEFGLVACGAAAPATKVVTITNTGAELLTWTATLAPTPDFSITGPSGGIIGSGDTGTLTISTDVPALTGSGETAQSVLTVTTNDTDKTSTAFPIRRTAGGGVLSITPLTAAFGETPATIKAQDIPIVLKNDGNQPISIGLGAVAPGGTGFSLAWTGAPAAVVVQPGASMPVLLGSFTPSTEASFLGTAAINVSGTLCGTNPSQITFTGRGTASTASVQPGSLDFGLVNCGATAAAKTIRIINSSATLPFNWNAALAVGTHYSLSATSGSVAASTFTDVTVTPLGIPSQSPVTANLYGDTLTITTNALTDDPHVVDLLMGARGAILAQSAGAVDFGSVLLSSPATSTVTVSNSGNAPATVSYTVAPAVFSLSPQNQVVGTGANYAATVRFAPVAQTQYSGTGAMTVAGAVLCAPLPPPLALTGQGALSAQVSPSTVDFGLVSCGSTGSAKTVTLTNTSASSFVWTATVLPANYTIAPANGTLAQGGSVGITVTPKAIPTSSSTAADLYAATLTFQTTPALESPYVSSMHMTASGAILTFNPTSLSFGNVKRDNSKTLPFTVVNTGNLAAPVTLNRSGDPDFSVSPSNGTANAGSSLSVNATFRPSGTGGANATVSVLTSANRCGALPAALTLTGNGT